MFKKVWDREECSMERGDSGEIRGYGRGLEDKMSLCLLDVGVWRNIFQGVRRVQQ